MRTALGYLLSALSCAAARLAVLLALVTGVPNLVSGCRGFLWRLLFWKELQVFTPLMNRNTTFLTGS